MVERTIANSKITAKPPLSPHLSKIFMVIDFWGSLFSILDTLKLKFSIDLPIFQYKGNAFSLTCLDSFLGVLSDSHLGVLFNCL